MDTKTRYVLASHLLESRNRIQAAAVMEKALRNAARPPKIIKTDRLGSYDDGIDMVFGGEVRHVKSDGIRAAINNNMSERLQGTFRERAKVMRGLQSRESGQKFLDGWVINYNLFRPHESLGGKTPAEAARVRPPFREWDELARPRQRAFTRSREFASPRSFRV